MKHNNYEHLINYFVNNEFDDPTNDPYGMLPSVRNDERNDDLLQMIVDYTNDEELLSDLETGVLKDMLVYYSKHSKGFTPVEFDYE